MSLPGLVADYGSESDSSSEEDKTAGGTAPVKINHTERSDGKNLLEASEDSSDDEEISETKVTSDSEGPAPCVKRLPNPLLHNPLAPELLSANGCVETDTAKFSVFTNQYREAEKAKHSILEKHVKMTESPGGGKGSKRQICFKFQKGKCRFGKSCKYSHDLSTVTVSDVYRGDDSSGQSGNFGNFPNPSVAVAYNRQIEPFQEDNDDDSYMANIKRKRRAGINDTLQPSKKALVPLEKQRASERPWTLGQN